MYVFYLPITSENLFNFLFKVGVFTSKLGLQFPLGNCRKWILKVIVRNGFSNDPKVTQIYEQRLGMCKLNFQSLICIMVQFIYSIMTLSKTTPKSQFHPWGKCTKYSPNAIKMSKMNSNA